MREILFRGKRRDNGEWTYGSLLKPIFGAKPAILQDASVDDSCRLDFEYHFVDPDTVGQYTGLTDKNGKKIFEGDICQIKNHRLITDTPFVVEWEDFVYNGWTWRDLDDDGSVDSFTSGAANYCEVIGNIHDNPELLEG